MTTIDMRLKRGDTAPPLRATLSDAGTPIDLTTATGIKVIGKRQGATLFSRTVTGTDQGLIVMPWGDADTQLPGVLQVEIEVTWAGGTVQSYPAVGYLTVMIDPDLG